MTTTEVEAGRELDALVAERVMAWPYLLCRPFVGTGVIETRDGTMSEFCSKCGRPHGYHDGWPHYSTDLRSAWLVVEKMRQHPDPRYRTLRMVAYSYNRTYATFDRDNEDDWTEANGTHATPLAICRAALAIVGE